jgi:hypothetical protein
MTETDTEVLKARIAKGLTLCNDIWQKMTLPETTEAEYKSLSDKLYGYQDKLAPLTTTLELQGFTGCVFGECKMSDQFWCFSCTKVEMTGKVVKNV